MADVKLVNVNKTYMGPERRELINAVTDFSLDISDGEFITLTGPPECGKTTLLRLIMGLEDPDSGEITVGGQRVKSTGMNPINTGMVFQSGTLYPHMTVYKNLAFPLKRLRLSKEETERRVLDAARFLQIEELLKLKPGQLNLEQNQRAAIARAMVSQPDVIAMDEPLNRLNDQERSRLRAKLIELRTRRAFTLVYVAYDLAEAMALGDRVVNMEEGQIVSVRTPEELLKQMEKPVQG